MNQVINDMIDKAYKAFNERDLQTALQLMTPNVHWPNGWEGGYVEGRDGVKDYWTRQWSEINPYVEPVSAIEREDGRIEVTVKLVVKDLEGQLLSEGTVKHIYTLKDNLIENMEIEK